MAKQLTPIQQIFANSPLNGGTYTGNELPQHKWKHPKGTWLQKRTRALMRKKKREDKKAMAALQSTLQSQREQTEGFTKCQPETD